MWLSFCHLSTYASLLVPLVVRAQFPPPPEGVTILKSKVHENITISYKEASSITKLAGFSGRCSIYVLRL